MTNDEGLNLGDVDPSWMEDGLGISGEQGEPDLTDDTQWDTTAWSQLNDSVDELPPTGTIGCLATAGNPPAMGTYVLGSVDGTCQWIDTTTC